MSGHTGPAGMVIRAFDPERDFPAVAALVRETNAHDAEPWLPSAAELAIDWTPHSGFVPSRDARLAVDGERLVGTTIIGWRDRAGTIVHNMEVWVRPADRRRGIGTALLRWAEDHAIELAKAGEGGSLALGHVLNGGVDRDNAAAIAFAAVMGYAPIRYGFLMQRDLSEPIPDAPLPDGIEIRPVREADHRTIWAADVEAFRDHWENAIREEADYQRFFGNPDLDTSLWRVAWEGDEVAGSVMTFIYPNENKELGVNAGWLQHVSTRRAYRGRGVAGALIARSLRVLKDRGMAFARLGVDGKNPTGALGLYKRFGFTESRMWINQRKPFPAGVGATPRAEALPEAFRASDTTA